MKATLSTFVAVETSSAVRAAAGELIDALRPAGADVKWVRPENMHLTLQFLGDVPTEQTATVCTAVAGAVEGLAPFELEIRGAGAFPHPGKARTIWLGAGEGLDAAVALHDRVEAALSRLGFKKERRRYTPHLTIGRVRRPGPTLADLGRLLREQADYPAGRFPVREVVVFSSQLEPGGPIYTALGRGRLGGA